MIAPEDGFAQRYVVQADKDKQLFHRLRNNAFHLDLHSVIGDEEFVGVRMIDQVLCNVFYSPSMPGFIAQRKR